jgi:pimeloyl-ACP methyl ester carboxylesterase
MGADEVGTLARLRTHRGELLDPAIEMHRGHIANTAGDSILAEFGSVVDAVSCAVEIQRSMLERNSEIPPDQRIEFRIGINLGDVVSEGTDIFGDGVNVAARLESLADRGGICISRQVLDQVEGKLDVTYRELGRQNLKNIAKPVEVFAIHLDAAASPGSRFLATANLKQEIRYCKAPDGVRLAYATVGSGPPMLKSAHWLGHLEYDWELPIARHLLLGLAKDHTLIIRRPRQRPVGLGRTRDFSRCLGKRHGNGRRCRRAPSFSTSRVLAGLPGGDCLCGPASRAGLAFDLVRRLCDGANKRSTLTAAGRERLAAMNTLVKQGWGADNPAFRQMFTSLLMPTANKDQTDAFNELQRLSASPECAARYLETVGDLTVLELLSQVKAPTIVMHVRDDSLVPSTLGRELAAGIPGARFVALPGKNHIPLEQDPSVPRLFEELKDFLRNVS